MKIISLINYKGGVGKTTLTANIGAQLAKSGKRVLLVDLDPQASLTFSFVSQDEWKEKYTDNKTIKNWYDAFIDKDSETTIDDLIIVPQKAQSRIKGGTLSLICSHLDLINVDLELATRLVGGTERDLRNNFLRVHARLRAGLQSLKDQFDIVLIDCPPNFNIVTKTAIVASDGIIVPTKADYLSTIGFDGLYRNVEKLKLDFNKYAAGSADAVNVMNPNWLGIVFTMVNLRLGEPIRTQKGFVRTIIDRSQQLLGRDIVIEDYTRENKTLHADAPEDGVPVVLENVPNQKTYIEVKGELVNVTNAVLKRIEQI
jgi:chromosome partitioning protein